MAVVMGINRYPQRAVDLGGLVNVNRYGAVGDGVADDTSAINAAMSAMPSGGTLVFPPGVYSHTGLGSSKVGETWLFQGGATLRLTPGVNNHCITITHNNFTIVGGVVDGTTQTGFWNGVFASGCDYITVKDVTVTNIAYRGIWGRNSNYFSVSGCRVSNTGELAIVAKPTDGAGADTHDVSIVGNFVDRTMVPGGGGEGGIKVHGTPTYSRKVRRVAILDNIVSLPTMTAGELSNVICIEAHNGVEDVTVVGNVTQGGAMGISLTSTVEGTVTGNQVLGPSFYGIELAEAPNSTVQGNSVDGQGICSNGIVQSQAGSVSSTISGNTIQRCMQDGIVINAARTAVAANVISVPAGGRYGIHATSAITTFALSGNIINMLSASYGINIAVGAKRFAVTGNSVNGNSVALKGIATDRPTGCTISGNAIYGCIESGVLVYAAAGPATIDNVTVVGNAYDQVGVPFTFQLPSGVTLGSAITVVDPHYGTFTRKVTTPTAVVLASNGSVTVDASTGRVVTVTLQANATSSTITNPTTGQLLTVVWRQDGSGGRTYAWPSNCKFASAGAPADTTANRRTVVTFQYDGTNWNEMCRAVAVG